MVSKANGSALKNLIWTGNPDMVALLRTAMATMEDTGCHDGGSGCGRAVETLGDAEYQVLLYEFKDGLNHYLLICKREIKSLKELIAFDLQNENKMMPFFKQEILVESEGKEGSGHKEYTEAHGKTLGFRKTLLDIIAANKLDALSGYYKRTCLLHRPGKRRL